MNSGKLQAAASVALLLTSSWAQTVGAQTAQQPGQAAPLGTQSTPPTTPQGAAQSAGQTGTQSNPTAPAPAAPQQVSTTGRPGVPAAPEPNHPGPLYLRETSKDYTNLKGHFPNPIKPYTSTDYRAPRLSNTPRINDLLRDGKLYLSLSDAILLALENNYDIAIARINLDIADTDILRARAGSTLRGVSTGLVTNTLGGNSTTVTGGGGPGGTATGAGGGGTGASGLVLSTNGGGPLPLNRDGLLTGTVQYEQRTSPGGSGFGSSSSGSNSGTGGGTGSGGTGTGGTGTGGTGSGGTGGTGGGTGGSGGTGGTGGSGGTGGTGGAGNLFNSNPTQTNTGSYNFNYFQGFSTGTYFNVSFNNSRVTSNSASSSLSPALSSAFTATVTQQLLQGFGKGVQNRFVLQAKNDRRIADSAFRQQLIYTITQVESIYWNLVSAYEDVQAKQRALQQSTQLANDNRRQLDIGTLAPLDVVNSDQAVSTDRQSLTTSESNLEYQQLLMKQAIVRDLDDPQLSAAPVVPTERVSLDRLAEEDTPVEDLVKRAYANSPAIEQAVLNMDNNKITIRGVKNGLLPQLNAYAFYGGSGYVGVANQSAVICSTYIANNPGADPVATNCGLPAGGYGGSLNRAFNNSAPDKGVGVTLNVPIRNRPAQADQARSQMEYRQAQMRLQQLYTQTRIQVVNQQYALTNDRASVVAAQSARDYQAQALDAEQKKYRLGASTTANVLQQERNLATAENNLISATAVYAKDRATLLQLLSNTLDRYSISIEQAAAGTLTSSPNIPGLTAPQAPAPPKPLTSHPDPLPPYQGLAAPGTTTPAGTPAPQPPQ